MSTKCNSDESVIVHIGNSSEKKKQQDSNVEDINVTIKQHIRRNSLSGDLVPIGEVSHPSFAAFRAQQVANTKSLLDSEEPVSNESQWKIGSCKCTKSLIIFIIHVIFSSVLIVFCIIQLCTPNIAPDLRTLYTSMLTGTISLYTPSPFQSKAKNK